jgi:hypothetical protein
MRKILLSGGYIALVDDDDYDRVVLSGQWQPLIDKRKQNRTIYVRRSLTLRSRKEARETGLPRRKTILLHRFILGIDDNTIKIDHKDGNGLNNQRDNLRVATHSENMQNRKVFPHRKYKGVNKNCNKWQAVIKINKQSVYLGTFRTEREAAFAYDEAAREYFGEFARCNF